MKTIRFAFTILLFVFCSLFGNTAEDEKGQHTSAFNQQWLRSLVSIEVFCGTHEISIGSGFLVGTPNNHIALITAKHVVYDKGKQVSDLAYRLNEKAFYLKIGTYQI